jgi:hypothetical protein
MRDDQEAEFAAADVPALRPRAADAIDEAAALVNEHHSVLSIQERQVFAGALVALRAANVPIDRDALRAHLMHAGWSGRLIDQAITLAERVARGDTRATTRSRSRSRAEKRSAARPIFTTVRD